MVDTVATGSCKNLEKSYNCPEMKQSANAMNNIIILISSKLLATKIFYNFWIHTDGQPIA